MAQLINVRLNKGDAANLGFRLQGGKDFGTPLVVQKVNFGSPAEKAGLIAGDAVVKINTTDVFNLRHKDAQDVIIRAGPSFEITVQRGGSTWKPTVTPLPKSAVSNNYSPVTQTSLAAKPQPSIGVIGTGHNLSAKPFNTQLNGAVNGGPKLVNKQYNSPVGLYSEQSIAETLSAQSEVLSTGVLGVNFKKNEKNYEPTNSEVFRMVHEADKEPRDAEPEPDSGVVSAPFGIGGLRHIQAPENKPAPAPQPQLPPGQNICAECERLVVGVFVRIKDKNLHVECFKCSTCGTSLKNVGYYNINNKLYCDVHAKLAARNNPPAPNLVPVTVPPGGKAPVGTISAALASHPLPVAPLSPLPSSNISAQPFQGGVNFSSPRPFSSVSAPLSPPSVNNYATLPKTSPTPAAFSSPAPSSEKSHSLQNIIWPPQPSSDELELPTATPLYFPPSTHIRIPTPIYHPKTISSSSTDQFSTVSNQHSTVQNQQTVFNRKEEYCEESLNIEHIEKDSSIEVVELENITQNMEAKMSLCSSEVTSYTERQMAVETIETAAETHKIVESLLQKRPKSPPPTDKDLQPRVEVETIPLSAAKSPATSSAQVISSPNEPRVVTRVCVCTNSCCNANTGELCESCPMRDLRRPKDYQKPKLKPVENSVPKRYGSPVITGVSVTINNPGRIKEAVKDLFTQIPDKRTKSALGAALATAPTEPFTPVGPSYKNEPIPLPEETKPYLPPERPIIREPKPEKPPKEKPQKPDTPFTSALRIAPDRPFTPVDMPPAPVKKKKPKEDPLLKELPKPKQWISMISALTTAPDRAYSPLVCEVTSSVKETVETGVIYEEEINKSKETQQKISKRSVHNETVLPKPFTKPVRMEKFEPVNDDRVTPQMQFPPISGQLKTEYEYKADYSEVKSEISSQIIEQAHLDEQTVIECKKSCDKPCDKPCKEQNKEQNQFQSEIREEECVKKTISECHQICSKATEHKKEERVIEKQTEETILKKPLELAGYLHKPEYLPQYQVDLRYDETIQLPHHKDIKKLLPSDQNKNSKRTTAFSSTQGQSRQTIESQYSSVIGTRQTESVMKPVRTIEPGERNVNIPQVVFQPVSEDPVPRTTFSPRPGSLTPSMINKPPPTLPYYQSNLVPQHMPAPETNLFDPKSPGVSRSPSPCPERAASPSPFGRLTPRPISPAAGPPPNPLTRGQPIPQFRKEDRLMQEAKKNISEFIPQYREKVDCIEFVQPDQTRELQVEISTEATSNMPITVPSINKYVQNAKVESCSFEVKKMSEMSVQETSTHSESVVTCSSQHQQSAIKVQEIQSQKSFENLLESCKAKVQEIKPPGPGEPHKPTEHPFKNVKNPDITDPGVTGMHITNPQRIVSPFLNKTKVQAQQEPPKPIDPPPPPRRISQTLPIQRRDTQPLPIQRKNTEPLPLPRKSSLPKMQNTTSVSTGEPSAKSVVNPSTNKTTTSTVPGVSASVPPTVSQTNTGAVGGRQSGAIGVAPKRGRGVLNVGGLIGSRVPICGCCHGQIRGPFITALGKIWCPEHFICATQSCRRQLQDLGFVEEQGQLYCEYCFEQYIAPPCSKCGIKVKGDCLKAIGKNFHPECFNCAYCGKLFGNSPFFLEDGQPYCENDWNELFTTKCFACGFPVEAGDRWVEALNNNYHSQCFNCTMCKKNLEGQSFFAKGGRPFCKNHAR